MACSWQGRLQIIERKENGQGNIFVRREEESHELIKSWILMKGDAWDGRGWNSDASSVSF